MVKRSSKIKIKILEGNVKIILVKCTVMSHFLRLVVRVHRERGYSKKIK